MVLLKLKGPHRRESERAKTRIESNSLNEPEQQRESAARDSKRTTRRSSTKSISMSSSPSSVHVGTAAAPRKTSETNSTSAASPGDTIKVQHKKSAVEISDDTNSKSPDFGPRYTHERVMTPPTGENIKSKSAPARKAGVTIPKARAGVDDLEMLDANEAVLEYDFSNDADRGEDQDDGRDTMWYRKSGRTTEDVITISSDDDKDEQKTEWDLNDRPWKNFDQQMRYQWEMMYCHVTDYAMNGDWGVTEDYQHEKDKEMLRYMEDFPLPEWLLPQHIVLDAYNRLIERTRWRGLGIRIYGRERIPEWTPGSTQQLHRSHSQGTNMQPSLSGPSNRHPREAPLTSRYSSGMPPPPHHHRTPNGSISQTVPPGMPQLPPHQVLRSQPNAQPVPTYPDGRPVHPPIRRPNIPGAGPLQMPNVPMQYGPPTFPLSMGYSPSPTQSNKRKGRGRKAETPPADSPPHPPPTPPYEKRDKPTERKPVNKSGRRNMRRQAEAEEFPWNRLDIDFKTARANARWDDSIYDPTTLASMRETRKHNEPIIERIDQAESERQRKSIRQPQIVFIEQEVDQTGQTRSRKKGPKAEASSELEQTKTGGRRKSSQKLPGVDGGAGDPYHSGHFEFTPKDQPKIEAFGNRSPDEIMSDVEDGKIGLNECAALMICWNPGKKGMTQDLEQARFSIKDTLLTRQQLAQTPILVKRAAECIVDFCPDMLWRGMLLRIASEAGYGNKQVRDRMCLNGNYCDKATITKRIGSALGQKQQQSTAKRAEKAKNMVDPAGDDSAGDASLKKVKGYAKGEDEYYNENVQDFGDYVYFFGHRTSHRSQLHLNQVGLKRKAIALDRDEGAFGAEHDPSGKSRIRAEVGQTTQSPEAMEISDDAETSAVDGEGSDSEGEGEEDAVSVQSDTILDQLDDD